VGANTQGQLKSRYHKLDSHAAHPGRGDPGHGHRTGGKSVQILRDPLFARQFESLGRSN
jgi:hypothetical protein